MRHVVAVAVTAAAGSAGSAAAAAVAVAVAELSPGLRVRASPAVAACDSCFYFWLVENAVVATIADALAGELAKLMFQICCPAARSSGGYPAVDSEVALGQPVCCYCFHRDRHDHHHLGRLFHLAHLLYLLGHH